MQDLEILYRPADLTYAELARCNALCFEDEPISEASYARAVQGDYWGAYLKETLIGYGMLSRTDQGCFIRRLAICPEQQNQGYGQRLLAAMIRRAAEAGCASLTLSARQDNLPAVHIYRKAGFRAVGERFQYLVDVEALVANAPRMPGASRVKTVPIPMCAPESLPESARHWRELHSHPDNLVLLFRERRAGYVGFCRLNPTFPGCSPFEVWRQEIRIDELLLALYDHLLPGKRRLKLTFSDERLAQALDEAGYPLNYKLFEMSLEIAG